MGEYNCLLCCSSSPGPGGTGGRGRRGRSSVKKGCCGCDEVTTLLEYLLGAEGERQRELLEEIRTVWRNHGEGKLCSKCDINVKRFWELKEELESIQRKMKELSEEIRVKIRKKLRGPGRGGGDGLWGLVGKYCEMIQEKEPRESSAAVKHALEEVDLPQPSEPVAIESNPEVSATVQIKLEPEHDIQMMEEGDFHDDNFVPNVPSPAPSSPASPPPKRRGRPPKYAPKPVNKGTRQSERSSVKTSKKKMSDSFKSTSSKPKLKAKPKQKFHKELVCDECGFKTIRPFKFEYHLRGHEAEWKASNPSSSPPFQCTICSTTYYTQRLYNFHKEGHEGKHRIVCEICSKICLHMDLPKHLKEDHSLEKIFQCPNCFYCGASRDRYMEHLRLHGRAQLSCDECDAKFSSKGKLLRHLHEVHNLINKFVCEADGCGKSFYTSVLLRQHQKHHNKSSECEQCGKLFAHRWALADHMRVHTGENKFFCQETDCSAAFKSMNSLKRHQIRVHGAPKPRCEDCGKEFSDEHWLTIHRQTVHLGKGVPCGKCPKILGNQTLWRRHQSVHAEQATHICEVCGKGFKGRGALLLHKDIHGGEKKYECQYCAKKFLRLKYLRDHERTHTGERPFVCTVCGRSFTQLGSLIMHNKQHAKEQEMEDQTTAQERAQSTEQLKN